MAYNSTKVYKSVEVDVDVDIEFDDVISFIENCNEREAKDILIAVADNHKMTADIAIDPIYDEVLSSDSWESRDKIAFLKTIFDKTSLEEFKNKLL